MHSLYQVCGNDEDWETFQSHAWTVEDFPRAPENEHIEGNEQSVQ